MNTLVKKIIICTTVLMTIAGNTVQAQKGIAVGGNFVIMFDSDEFLAGLAPKIQYYITEHFRGEADATFLLPKNSMIALDVSVNAHYLFEINERTSVYPVAGLGMYSQSTIKRENLSSWPTAALGGGIEHALSSHFTINGELKYKLLLTSTYSTSGFGMLTAGIVYKF